MNDRNYTFDPDKPYRVQEVNAHNRDVPLETYKAYETLEDALHAAKVQLNNIRNRRSGNSFIVFKAVALVQHSYPSVEVVLLDE